MIMENIQWESVYTRCKTYNEKWHKRKLFNATSTLLQILFHIIWRSYLYYKNVFVVKKQLSWITQKWKVNQKKRAGSMSINKSFPKMDYQLADCSFELLALCWETVTWNSWLQVGNMVLESFYYTQVVFNIKNQLSLLKQ